VSGQTTTPTNKEKVYARTLTGTSPVEIYKFFHKPEELSVDEMFAQLELTDSRAAAATEVGTRWVAQNFFSESPLTLATLRMRAGLSQRELGKRLCVSQPQIAKWEKGEIPNMQLKTIKNLAKALSVSLYELVSILIGKIEETPNEH